MAWAGFSLFSPRRQLQAWAFLSSSPYLGICEGPNACAQLASNVFDGLEGMAIQ